MEEPAIRASTMRDAYRSAGMFDRHSRCLQHCVALMQQPGERREEQLLEAITEHFGAPHGALLSFQGGRLRVISAVGGTAVTASRQPIKTALSPFLKWPCKPYLRESPAQAWLFYTQHPGYEWFVPLALGGVVTGLLVLAGHTGQALPGQREQQLAEILAGLLVSLTSSAAGQQREPSRKRADNEALSLLSPREKEILSLLPRGMSNARMAAALDIAPGTVKTHMERILAKLQLEDRAHAAARAVELKLGDTGSGS